MQTSVNNQNFSILSGSSCDISYKGFVSGNRTVCQLTIAGVSEKDHGDWTCAVSDSASLETVKQSVSVSVVVVGEVRLSPVVASLLLGEGDLAQLVCRVTAAWPRPHIVWTSHTAGHLNTDTEVWTEQEADSHLVTLSQTVTYSASLADNGGNITCTVSQAWDDEVELQTRSLSLQILPTTALRNSGNTMVDKVGILSLVFVSLLVLILVLVILTMVGLKRRCSKREVYRPVYNCQAESDLLYSQPRNISYIDLYNHKMTPPTQEVRNKDKGDVSSDDDVCCQAEKDASKDSHSSSGLGSSSVSFNDTGSDCGDGKSVRTFKETHFDTFDSRTLPTPSQAKHGEVQCVHTLPYTLFHCQHACFSHHHHHHQHNQQPDCK